MTTDIEPLYPWQVAQFQQLTKLCTDNRLPHALLFSGPAQVGKAHFTRHLVQYLLCRSPAGEACGECDTCLLVKAGSHPDNRLITLTDSKQIRVEQIRDILGWENQTANQGGRMVCVLDPAETMNHQAANALLKSLEEPTPNTILILITHQATRLLPTIRSRCHKVNFPLPPTEVAVTWLKSRLDQAPELLLEMAGGSPLKVINELDDTFLNNRQTLAEALLPLSQGTASPLQLAAQLADENPVQLLEILYSLVADSLQHSLTQSKLSIKNKDLHDILQKYSELAPLEQRFTLLDSITQAQNLLSSPSNANPRMLLERVLSTAALAS